MTLPHTNRLSKTPVPEVVQVFCFAVVHFWKAVWRRYKGCICVLRGILGYNDLKGGEGALNRFDSITILQLVGVGLVLLGLFLWRGASYGYPSRYSA